jgi:preprotein translocase subunit Sss1
VTRIGSTSFRRRILSMKSPPTREEAWKILKTVAAEIGLKGNL